MGDRTKLGLETLLPAIATSHVPAHVRFPFLAYRSRSDLDPWDHDHTFGGIRTGIRDNVSIVFKTGLAQSRIAVVSLGQAQRPVGTESELFGFAKGRSTTSDE